jgi:hypothetical protein
MLMLNWLMHGSSGAGSRTHLEFIGVVNSKVPNSCQLQHQGTRRFVVNGFYKIASSVLGSLARSMTRSMARVDASLQLWQARCIGRTCSCSCNSSKSSDRHKGPLC